MTDTQKWFRVYDSKGDMSLTRGSDYEDATQQVVTIRRRHGMYRDVPEYDQFLLLIGGPLNPVRVEVFELRNMGNGMAMDEFKTVLDDDANEIERKRTQDAMPQGGTSFSGRFG